MLGLCTQENGGPGHIRSGASSSPHGSASGSSDPGQPELELLCAGQAVPLDMTLAAVKAFIWKKPQDMQILFRLRNPAHPAPMPQIKPPP